MNNITSAFNYPKIDEENDPGWRQLKLAVSHMASATETQKFQLREFQTSMKDMKASVDKLGRTCEKHQRRLEKIPINRLRRQCLKLAKTMDASLTLHVVGE